MTTNKLFNMHDQGRTFVMQCIASEINAQNISFRKPHKISQLYQQGKMAAFATAKNRSLSSNKKNK